MDKKPRRAWAREKRHLHFLIPFPKAESECTSCDGEHMAEEQMQQLQAKEEKEKAPELGRIVGIKELVDAGLREVPPLYVLPPHERPSAAALAAAGRFSSSAHLPPQLRIPIIDATPLSYEEGHAARTQFLRELSHACEDWGFFQIVNHGVDTSVIQSMRQAAARFFDQPAEERMRFCPQSGCRGPVVYNTSFNPAMEEARNWRDVLGLSRLPGVCDGFRDAPDICKKEVKEYIREVEGLAQKLYKAIFQSLGLDNEYMERNLPSIPWVRMAINYYPHCPDPHLTFGINGHSDITALTILLPDANVAGLEINHEGNWIPVFPMDPSTLVVNLADQIEILTNGKYKSIEHRVITNAKEARMSMACFFGPSGDTIVGPLPILLDANNPPLYKPTKFKDYNHNFYADKLQPNKGSLNFARI